MAKTQKHPSEAAWLSFYQFISAAYQYLIVLELSATYGPMVFGRLVTHFILATVGLCYGVGAYWGALKSRGRWADGGRGIWGAFVGLTILASLGTALLADNAHAPLLLVGFPLVAGVFVCIGGQTGLLYLKLSEARPGALTISVFYAGIGLLLGYFAAVALGTKVGVNAALAALGVLALLGPPAFAASSRLMAWLSRAGLLAATVVIAFLPVDHVIEHLRVKNYFHILPGELRAIRENHVSTLFDGWSNLGKTDIYRTEPNGHVFGTYDYYRVWSVSDRHRDFVGLNDLTLALSPRQRPLRMLSIGVGGGGLLSGLPPDVSVTGVELNESVVDFFTKHPEFNGGAFLQHRVVAQDGRAALDEISPGDRYDVVRFESADVGTAVFSDVIATDAPMASLEGVRRALDVMTTSGTFLFCSVSPLRVEQVAAALGALGRDPHIFRSKAFRLGGLKDPLSRGGGEIALECAASFTQPSAGAWQTLPWKEIPLPTIPDVRSDDRPYGRWIIGGKSADGNPDMNRGRRIGIILGGGALAILVFFPRGARPVPQRFFYRIGLAFVLLQIFLLAKFRSFGGDFLRTAIGVNCVFLLFASLGSLIVDRWMRKPPPLPAAAGGLLVAFLYTRFALAHIPFGIANFWGKGAVAILIIAPISLCAGLFFPLGLSSIEPGRVGRALLWDGVGSFLAVPLFFATTGLLGISYNQYWVALAYGLACADLTRRT